MPSLFILYGTNSGTTMEQFINIPHSTPQSSILGIFDNIQHSGLINHLLLIFKCYIYSGRNTKQLNFDNLKITIKKIKELEKELTSFNKLKLLKKWHPVDHMIDWYSFQSEKERGREWLIHFSFIFVPFFVFLYWSFIKSKIIECFILVEVIFLYKLILIVYFWVSTLYFLYQLTQKKISLYKKAPHIWVSTLK